MTLRDRHGRPLRNLRISVTDRCNLRCDYCMPDRDYVWLPRGDILTFEEIARLVDCFLDVGVDRVRLTGGEPLLRRGLPELVALLAARPGLRDLALTTNGLLLADQARDLRRAGLRRVTVSLDTLRPERFVALARRPGLDRVLAGIEAARREGLLPLKLDAVVIRGANEDELPELVRFARAAGAEIRFIEFMDVGGATTWSPARVVPRSEILERITAAFGPAAPVPGRGSAPAERFRLPDGTIFGVISSTTQPFCGACDRSRLTADGRWYLCLYAREGADLRALLRSGATDEEIRAAILRGWTARTQRGAEERLAERERRVLADRDELRRNPHLEMHKRGG